jgi:hypothetical protein
VSFVNTFNVTIDSCLQIRRSLQELEGITLAKTLPHREKSLERHTTLLVADSVDVIWIVYCDCCRLTTVGEYPVPLRRYPCCDHHLHVFAVFHTNFHGMFPRLPTSSTCF